MSIINEFLYSTLTQEQASLIIFCCDTLSSLGFTEIDVNLDELLDRIDEMDTPDVVIQCYGIIESLQRMAFDSLNIKVNLDDVGKSNDLLIIVDMLEDSDNHEDITNIIEEAMTPEDAFLDIIEQVLYMDSNSVSEILYSVSGEFMSRLQTKHHTELSIVAQSGKVVKPMDGRKLKIIKDIWSAKDFNPVRDFLYGKHDLPISKEAFLNNMRDIYIDMEKTMKGKDIAEKLLEACLVMPVDWGKIKKAMRYLSNELYDDLMFKTKLNYDIDNICMEYGIDG